MLTRNPLAAARRRTPERRRRSCRQALLPALSLCIGMALPPVAQADSLFPIKQAAQSVRGSSSSNSAALFSDTHAHDVGDILTVQIAENTTAASTAELKATQDDTVGAFGGTGLFQRLFKAITFSGNQNRASNGAGQTTRSGSLATTLSVVVKEVLPNGTLRIEGVRLVTINKETQRVTFTGIVRPEDIGQDNSIASNLVANAEVHYDGKGSVGDTTRVGILSRIFRILF